MYSLCVYVSTAPRHCHAQNNDRFPCDVNLVYFVYKLQYWRLWVLFLFLALNVVVSFCCEEILLYMFMVNLLDCMLLV